MEEIRIPTEIECENYTIRLNKTSSLDESHVLEVEVLLKKKLVFTDEFLRTIKDFDVDTFIKDWVKNKVR